MTNSSETSGKMNYERIRGECYSGYKANERPVAFEHRGRFWTISEIMDRWYEGGLDAGRPKMDYFKVRTSGGQIFLLRYSSLFDAWSVRI